MICETLLRSSISTYYCVSNEILFCAQRCCPLFSSIWRRASVMRRLCLLLTWKFLKWMRGMQTSQTWTMVSFDHCCNINTHKVSDDSRALYELCWTRECVSRPWHTADLFKTKHVTLICLVAVLRSCLVCIGLDSVLVGKLSELSHLSSWANRVSEALLSHLNDTNPLRAVATAPGAGINLH